MRTYNFEVTCLEVNWLCLSVIDDNALFLASCLLYCTQVFVVVVLQYEASLLFYRVCCFFVCAVLGTGCALVCFFVDVDSSLRSCILLLL